MLIAISHEDSLTILILSCSVTYLVLDEADRMLDKGFENDIRTIIGHTSSPEKRQTLMCKHIWYHSSKHDLHSIQLARLGLIWCGSSQHLSYEVRYMSLWVVTT